MKVFTVGLEDKEKAKQNEEKNSDMTKIPIDSSSSTPSVSPRPPIVIPRSAPRKPFKGCGVISWLVAAFFVILLCLTISEIAYNRQRDQAFLRLKWAELRQRMLGYELMSQVQQQQQIQPLDERLAFNRRSEQEQMDALPLRETPTVAVPQQIENSHEHDKSLKSSSESDSRLSFLRALLERIREKAVDMGLSGDMQVHVIEVKPVHAEQMDQRAWDDGFGEVAVPKQFFPSQREEDYQDFDRFPEWNQQQPWHQQRSGRHFDRFDRFDRLYDDNEAQENMNGGPDWNMAAMPFNDRPMFGQQQPQMNMPFPMQQPQWNMAGPQFPSNEWHHPAAARDFAPQMSPSEPSVGQQNQFPYQNQNPSMVPPPSSSSASRPWYMSSGDESGWAQTWNNDWQEHKQDEMPFQPHPAAAASSEKTRINWIDRATVERGEDSDGIDNFRTQERFNVPVDIAADADPVSVEKHENDANVHAFRANTWQHTQPAAAIETAPSVVPPAASDMRVIPSSEDRDFLPIRQDDDAAPADDGKMEPVHDSFDKKFDSPFFQIDDPSSFRH